MDFIEIEKTAEKIVTYSAMVLSLGASTYVLYTIFIANYVESLKEKFKKRGLEKKIDTINQK